MNMFARFDENPAMTLQDIKETKRYGRTDGRTDVKTVYPPQTKFAGFGGGIIKTDTRCQSAQLHNTFSTVTKSIGTASANSVKFHGIRPLMYIKDLL